MRKRKISVSVGKTGKSPDKLDLISSSPAKAVRFVGVSLAGGKSDKACIAVIEYYPENKKVFLSRLYEKIKSDEKISGDLKIHELILQNAENLKYVAFDTPWSLPNCLTCKLKCPGFENCKEPHIQWMWDHQIERVKKKKPKKLFTPYTQRCVELFFATELEEIFNLHHAMGANSAPLLARAAFIQRRITFDCVEVFPKLSMWRIGHYLGLMKSILRDHRAAFGGEESRAQFIQALNEKNLTFIYHQDSKSMVENSHAFDAFLCALTAFLKFKKQTEPRPKKFPTTESWIEFPKENLDF
jgi:hypothetical protein